MPNRNKEYRLMREARKSAEWRGHTMARVYRTEYWHHLACACSVCGMSVSVDANPAMNGIDIGGEAVALNCKVEE
jgi:hypothetical protein